MGVDSESIARRRAGSNLSGTAVPPDKSMKKLFAHTEIQKRLGKAEAVCHGLLLHAESLHQEVKQLRAEKAQMAKTNADNQDQKLGDRPRDDTGSAFLASSGGGPASVEPYRDSNKSESSAAPDQGTLLGNTKRGNDR